MASTATTTLTGLRAGYLESDARGAAGEVSPPHSQIGGDNTVELGPGWVEPSPSRGVVEFSAKAQNRQERFVDTPELFVGQVPDQIAEPACIDGADLLDEDPGGIAFDLGLGSE